MNFLSVENLSKYYGEKLLFKDLSFGIDQGERVALIAKNGTGKTTLLRILCELEPSDGGNVVFRKDLRISFLQQEQHFDKSLTASQVIFHGNSPALVALKNYEEAIASGNENDLSDALEAMDREKAWDIEVKASTIITNLNLDKILTQSVATLSGGQLKRLALAQVLIDEPDFLILDEPTNHLDLEMIEWLEGYLSSSKLTIFMVSHDRYFLEKVCSEIIEIDEGQLYKYKGSYAYFLGKKAEREENMVASTVKAKNLMRRELEWIRKQPKARGTKAKYRVDAFEGIKEDASKKLNTSKVELEMKMERLGSKIIELHNISKAFDEKKMLDKFSYHFKRKDRVGIVGRNGVGKSTFLNMLTGTDVPDSGKIVVGETIVFGYYNQKGMNLKEDMRAIEVIKEIAEVIPMAGGKKLTASQLLEKFLFTGDMQYSYVSKLSGGERKRLYLCTILIKNPNFLILDEPTNDLDIQTLNVLEEFLEEFEGCLVLVSHDRFFMDKLVDHMFVFQGEGHIKDFPGNYTDYRESDLYKNRNLPPAEQMPEKKILSDAPVTPVAAAAPSTEKKKISYKEKLEYEKLEGELEALEKKKSELETELSNVGSDHSKLMNITEQLGKVVADIDFKTERWIILSELV
ncbi:MAG: ABC-F family ATP-binding cassette domain-containing protein [Bacteroidota bacterium]